MSASPYRDSPPQNDFATPKNISYMHERWREAVNDLWKAINSGHDAATTPGDGVNVPEGAHWSVLEVLRQYTLLLAQLATDRYTWFDPGPLWEVYERARLWTPGDRSVESIARLNAL